MTLDRKIDLDRAKRIVQVRKEILRLRSQEDFAAMIGGVTRGAVGNWELGKEVGLANLVTISKLAGVDLNWLAYGEGDMFPDARQTAINKFKEEHEAEELQLKLNALNDTIIDVGGQEAIDLIDNFHKTAELFRNHITDDNKK